jgi:hypothetical protein
MDNDQSNRFLDGVRGTVSSVVTRGLACDVASGAGTRKFAVFWLFFVSL